MTAELARPLEEEAWLTLVDSVLAGTCTPFLGAGVAWPHLPSGRALAQELAERFDYPLDDPWNLPRVAQYLATVHQPAFAKRRVQERLQQGQEAYLAEHGTAPENHRRLALLHLPVYITTNYDNLLERAMDGIGRTPVVETARWSDRLLEDLGPYPEHKPTPDAPVLFHLHGDLRDAASLLLTEDDYIDFTVSLALRPTERSLLWHPIRRALSTTSLLFVGYSLADWNFRVLMRYLLRLQHIVRSDQSFSLSIQLGDSGLDGERRERAERFLDKYLQTSSIQVHWTDASVFLEELSRRVAEARSS